jgi:hypothetical protein
MPFELGDAVGGPEHLAEALALFRELGDQREVAESLRSLARVCQEQGNLVRAAELAE